MSIRSIRSRRHPLVCDLRRVVLCLLTVGGIAACGAPQAPRASDPNRSAHTRHPAEFDRAFDRGLAALERGDGPTAHAAFSEVLSLDPTRTDARIDRALASLLLGRTSDAIADVRHVLDLRDPSAETLRTIGGILLRAGASGEAESLLRRAREEGNGHADLVRAIDVELAILDARAGRHDQAARRLEGVLAQSRDATALTNLARIRVAQQNESEALALYEEALDLTPFDPALLRSASELLAARGQTARAADLLQRLIHLLPADHAERSTLESTLRDLRSQR
jgi:tetratricopeptide (TPR) repeat protein